MKTQILKDITYRVNSMLAWDLMVYTEQKYADFNKRRGLTSVYSNSLVLEPAFEISIVFGRQLLDFLRINYDSKLSKLEDKIELGKKQVRADDVYINFFQPNITSFPLDHPLTKENEIHLSHLLKVANKAAAHLTSAGTTQIEFESLTIAKQTIYELILHYVPALNKDLIWWSRKDDQRNATLY